MSLRATKSSPATLGTGHAQGIRVLDSFRLRTITNWAPFHISEEEEEDQGDEDRADVVVRGPGPKGPAGTLSEAQLARRIAKGKNSRRMLSNKPQDFQVGKGSAVLCIYCHPMAHDPAVSVMS